MVADMVCRLLLLVLFDYTSSRQASGLFVSKRNFAGATDNHLINDIYDKDYPTWQHTICKDALQFSRKPEQNASNSLISTVPGLCNPLTSTCSKIVFVGGDGDGIEGYTVFLNVLRKRFTDVSDIIFLALDDGSAHANGVKRNGGDANCQGRDVLSWFAVEDSCTTKTKNELRRSLAQLDDTPDSFLITHSTGYTFVAQLMAEEPALFKGVQTAIFGSPLIELTDPVHSFALKWVPKSVFNLLDPFLKISPEEPLGTKTTGIDGTLCGICTDYEVRRYLGHLMWIGDRMRIVGKVGSQRWNINTTIRTFRLDYDTLNSAESMQNLCDNEQKALCTGETVFPGITGDSGKDRWGHGLFQTTPIQTDALIHEIHTARAIAKTFRYDGQRKDRRVSDFTELPTDQRCNRPLSRKLEGHAARAFSGLQLRS